MAIRHAAPTAVYFSTLRNQNTLKTAGAVWGLGRGIRIGLVLTAVLFAMTAAPVCAQTATIGVKNLDAGQMTLQLTSDVSGTGYFTVLTVSTRVAAFAPDGTPYVGYQGCGNGGAEIKKKEEI